MKREGPILYISLLVFLCAAVTICFSVTGFVASQTFNNALETSGVDVKIETRGGGQTEPGQIVEYAPVVTNLNADSFIRVCFDQEPEEVFELGKDWVKRGHYYYCKTAFASGDSREVFSRIKIPENVDRKGNIYKVRATADAIQARNFSPDFESVSPWGTIEVQKTNASGRKNQLINEAVQISSPDFNYVKPGTFECSTRDLFSNFDQFQPGDSCSEMLNMRNNSGKKMVVYFRTDNLRTELLEEMKLRIKCCGNLVYQGSLSSEKLDSFMEIASIESGQAGRLEFQISMPVSADNRYAMLQDNVTWIIAVKDDTATANFSENSTVRTGENVWLLASMLTLAVTSLLGIIMVLLMGRRRKKDE